jgi:hypothetical protein
VLSLAADLEQATEPVFFMGGELHDPNLAI